MKISKEEDFKKIIDLIRIKPEIKELMEGVMKTMNENEEFVGRYYDWKEENDRINQAIIKEEKAESFKEGILETKKEVVLNMYKDKVSTEIISQYTNLTLEEVETIINNSNK